MADNKVTWLTTRAYRAGKSGLRLLMGGGSHIYPDGKSFLDLPEELTHLHSLTLKAQYQAAKQFAAANNLDDVANHVLGKVKVPTNINCLDNIQNYIDARDEAVKKADSTAPIFFDNQQGADQIKQEITKFKHTIQRGIIQGNKVGVFSLHNQLVTIKNLALAKLKNQYDNDVQKTNETSRTEPQKKTIIDALTKHHEAALKTVEETITAEIKKQLSNARYENSRLAFMKLCHDQDATKMKKLLVELAAAKASETSIQATSPNVGFEDVSVDQLVKKKFTTLSGLSITQASGTFTIQLPSRLNLMYHNLSLQDNVLADLKMLALAVHASKHEKITMNISGKNEEETKHLARKAYQACIEVGFKGGEKGNIQIKINGAAIPLFNEIKDGNITKKGVFNNQDEMDMFCKFSEETRTTIEEQDKWVDTGAITLSSKQALEQDKQASAALAPKAEVSGDVNPDPGTTTISGGPN